LDECKGGAGGVEAEGSSGDQSDDVVESFGASVVDAEPEGGEDAVAVFADALGRLGERFESRSAGSAEPSVDQFFGFGLPRAFRTADCVSCYAASLLFR
jgi:hypothetical protein